MDRDLIGLLIRFVFFITLVGVGYFVGRKRERAHYQSIIDRELALVHLPSITSKLNLTNMNVTGCGLVTGIAVISPDYFKWVASQVKSFFGGRVSVYESLLDRARREAILRMKEDARRYGATQIINVRLETSSISGSKSTNQNSGVQSVEVIAYGTAIRVA